MNVKIKKLNEKAMTPLRGSKRAAGYDLCACLDNPVAIPPHTTVKIGTGLAMALPKGYFAAIYARSGLATKKGLAPANKVGVCDEDYRGEYIVALHNHSDVEQTVEPGERIAQVILQPYFVMNFEEVDDLDDTARGAGGFGSTGA